MIDWYLKQIDIGSNSITLIKVNVKPYEYDKMYVDKDLIEDKWYQLLDKFNSKKIIIGIVILYYYLAIYIHFIMTMENL